MKISTKIALLASVMILSTPKMHAMGSLKNVLESCETEQPVLDLGGHPVPIGPSQLICSYLDRNSAVNFSSASKGMRKFLWEELQGDTYYSKISQSPQKIKDFLHILTSPHTQINPSIMGRIFAKCLTREEIEGLFEGLIKYFEDNGNQRREVLQEEIEALKPYSMLSENLTAKLKESPVFSHHYNDYFLNYDMDTRTLWNRKKVVNLLEWQSMTSRQKQMLKNFLTVASMEKNYFLAKEIFQNIPLEEREEISFLKDIVRMENIYIFEEWFEKHKDKKYAFLNIIQLCINYGSLDMIKFLIRHEANPFSVFPDDRGNTALHLAVRSGSPEFVKFLAHHFPKSINMPTSLGTPLHALVHDNLKRNGYNRFEIHILNALLDAGANINKKDHVGHPPLYYAATAQHYGKGASIGKILVDKGANPDLVKN